MRWNCNVRFVDQCILEQCPELSAIPRSGGESPLSSSVEGPFKQMQIMLCILRQHHEILLSRVKCSENSVIMNVHSSQCSCYWSSAVKVRWSRCVPFCIQCARSTRLRKLINSVRSPCLPSSIEASTRECTLHLQECLCAILCTCQKKLQEADQPVANTLKIHIVLSHHNSEINTCPTSYIFNDFFLLSDVF